jgi:hypothetical protein
MPFLLLPILAASFITHQVTKHRERTRAKIEELERKVEELEAKEAPTK